MALRRRIINRGVVKKEEIEAAEAMEIDYDEVGTNVMDLDEEEDVQESVEEVYADEDEEEPVTSNAAESIPETEHVSEEPEDFDNMYKMTSRIKERLSKNRLPSAKTKVVSSEIDEDGTIVEHEKPVLRKKGTNPVIDILENMEVGTVLMVLREDRDSWKVTVTNDKFSGIVHPVATGVKLSGKAFWDTVTNPDYIQWNREWSNLTMSEKKQRAIKLGVTWEKNPNPKIEAMLLTAAVREKLGIVKYKPEFSSRASRSNIRAH